MTAFCVGKPSGRSAGFPRIADKTLGQTAGSSDGPGSKPHPFPYLEEPVYYAVQAFLYCGRNSSTSTTP